MANIFDGIRRWIDGESEDTISENIQKAQDNKSESELFLQRLLNEIEVVLRSEIVRVPNTNKAYAPDKFVVFLNADADKNLRRDKREFFENGLSVMIYERAKELANELQLSAKKMTVEIVVDATLEDEIEVRAVSKNELATVKEIIADDAAADAPDNRMADGATIEDYGTVKDAKAQFGVLYYVEIWRDSRKLGEYPIIQRVNTVGREITGEDAANLRLPTDNLKISRIHAEIEYDANNKIQITARHKNPTVVSGQVIRDGERATLGADNEVMIYDFTLRFVF